MIVAMNAQRPKDGFGGVDPGTRRVAATTVAAGLIGWWPAFTLGAWGVVFFEQILALWVATTSIFLVVLLSRPHDVARQPAWLALLIPSGWIAVALMMSTGGTSLVHNILFYFGVLVTILGFPAMAALLIRLLVPGAERLRGRRAVVALLVVVFVMSGSFLLGRLHPRLLTCEDFTISGNAAPPGCTPGEGTTVG